jgi:CheY-like chemotaxis protein
MTHSGSSRPDVSPGTAEAGRRIVVVEDSPDVREALGELLQLWGFEVHVAATGEEGVALIGKVKPHVAIVDLGLPDIDGCEVARRVLAARIAETPRLIALTGFGRDVDSKRVMAAGFHAHMLKPPDVDELQQLLNKK